MEFLELANQAVHEHTAYGSSRRMSGLNMMLWAYLTYIKFELNS